MGNESYSSPIIVTSRTELLVELQMEVIPFLKEKGYPVHKMDVLDTILVAMAEKAEKVRGKYGNRTKKAKL